MGQTGTANLADFEPGNATATASLDEFQPEVLPAVERAIRTVPPPAFAAPAPDLATRAVDQLAPRPVVSGPPTGEMPGSFEGHPENVGELGGKYLQEGPVKAVQGVARAAKAAARFPAPSSGYESRGITHGTGTPAIPEEVRPEFYKGLSEAISGAGTTLLPLAPAAAAAAPVATAIDLAAGYGLSKAAGAIAHKAGASPEAEDMWRTAGFWFPTTRNLLAGALGLKGAKVQIGSSPEATGVGIAGEGGTRAGVAVTPEEIRVGGQFRGGPQHTVRIPRTPAQEAQPALEPPTIEGQVAPTPHPGAPVDNVAEGAN